jgi:hypothetical protein
MCPYLSFRRGLPATETKGLVSDLQSEDTLVGKAPQFCMFRSERADRFVRCRRWRRVIHLRTAVPRKPAASGVLDRRVGWVQSPAPKPVWPRKRVAAPE